MAIRFRKSFKLAPGIRMNFSTSGVGASFGPRGASVSVGKRGVFGNVGIAGTGLSARSKLSGGQTGSAYRAQPLPPQITNVPLTVGVRDDGELFFQDQTGAPLAEHLVAMAKKQHGDTIKGLIQRKCDEINEQIEAVGELHLDTPSPHERPCFVACAYSESCPVPPTPQVPGFFAKFLASKRANVEAQNEAAMRRHEFRVGEWEAGLAMHTRAEAKRRIHVEELIYSDIEAMETQLEDTLQDIAWPRETLAAAELLDDGQRVFIDVDLPEIEDMPDKTAGMPQRGMKLSVKAMSPTQVQRLYMLHIHSIGFRIVGETFAALPKVKQVVLSGYSQRRDKATGRTNDEYLYSVRVTRVQWHSIEFSRLALKGLDPAEALGQFELRRSMSKTGVFKAITPFSIQDQA